MILRKPYAFFIKQFKTIHFILTLLISFLIYRTTIMIAFFNEYLTSTSLYVDPTAPDKLFKFYNFAIPILIILISITVLWVLFLKKKPFLFYIINIVIYIFIIVIYNYSLNITKDMIEQAVHLRTIRLVRDLLLISILAQMFTIIKAFVYATGFDIKKFNFGQDLAELDIEEDDDEEFEFDVEIDTNKAHRHVRKRARFSRYVYIENKFLINISFLLLLSTTLLIVYFNQNIYNKTYSEKVSFFTRNFTMNINRSFITKMDPKNKELSKKDMSFVVVEVELKNNSVQKEKIDIARMQLIANKKIYYHKYGYNTLVPDLGFVYNDTHIPKDFSKVLLVYEVPDEYLKRDLQFRVLDDFGYSGGNWHPKYIKINLKPTNLDKITKKEKLLLGDKISFKGSILEDTSLEIKAMKISVEHKVSYKFCMSNDECYDSYEYIKPDIQNVYDKTILHLNASINWDNKLTIIPIIDMFQFLNTFGEIQYKIKGEIKTHAIELREVRPEKTKRGNNYYIELLKEVDDAEDVFVIFNIRNHKYEYKLK